MTDFLNIFFQRKKPNQTVFVAIVILIVALAGLVYVTKDREYRREKSNPLIPILSDQLDTFSSADDFKEYLINSKQINDIALPLPEVRMLSEPADLPLTGEVKTSDSQSGRFSLTNVQVQGIDEPDIVKTDGEIIYLSVPRRFEVFEPVVFREGRVAPLPKPDFVNTTKLIRAKPIDKLGIISKVKEQGNLLLAEKVLVILQNKKITAFAVDDPTQPSLIWQIELTDKSSLVTARLYQNKIFIVSRSQVDFSAPCPVKPLISNGDELVVPCQQIYHPVEVIPVESVYTLAKVDIGSGKVEAKRAVVGSGYQSVVYMSPNFIYLTYPLPARPAQHLFDFWLRQSDLLPADIISHLADVQKYNLSDQAKMAELEATINRWKASLSSDERLQIDNDINNRLVDFYQNNLRRFDKTGIVKFDLDSLKVVAKSEVPGRLLNQFSLDENDGNLRLATTLGASWSWRWRVNNQISVSDLYILDKGLKQIGTVQNLGKGERIYAVRFLGKYGYVVTFRQTDPFYVIDLSRPSAPRLLGELKIPGYSSYLHPLFDDLILGVGKEGAQVKLSLFDVKDPQNPQEIGKYMLAEYFSEVLNNHRAFLVDPDKKIFFLPGNKGGYIFSFADKKLDLVRAVNLKGVLRAVYIDDYFYIISSNEIIVLDQNSWQEVNKLTL